MNIRYTYAIPLHCLHKHLYGGVSLQSVFPTGTDRSLGSEKWQLYPGIGTVYFRGYDEAPSGTISLMVEYRFSYAGNENRPDIRILAFAPNVDWWFKKGYIGYYGSWTYNLESQIFDLHLDVEIGYNLAHRLVLYTTVAGKTYL